MWSLPSWILVEESNRETVTTVWGKPKGGNKEGIVIESIRICGVVLFQIKEVVEKSIIGKGNFKYKDLRKDLGTF